MSKTTAKKLHLFHIVIDGIVGEHTMHAGTWSSAASRYVRGKWAFSQVLHWTREPTVIIEVNGREYHRNKFCFKMFSETKREFEITGTVTHRIEKQGSKPRTSHPVESADKHE